MNTGKRIAELRMLSGLSQEKLAERLNVSRSEVAKWETGRRRPDRMSVDMMSALFGVSPESIVERNEDILSELSSCLPDGLHLSGEELKGELNRFLSSLRKTDRIIFLRRYHFLDRPAEIAQSSGLTKGQVRMILFRTRKKLKAHLSSLTEKRQ